MGRPVRACILSATATKHGHNNAHVAVPDTINGRLLKFYFARILSPGRETHACIKICTRQKESLGGLNISIYIRR